MTHTNLANISIKQKKTSHGIYLSDLISGLMTALAVTPPITIIDKSVIQNANGSVPLWKGLNIGFKDLFQHPVQFSKRIEFWWIYFVYATTYPTSNLVESYCQNRDIDPVLPKFWATFLVNSGSSIMKDKALATLFGQKSSAMSFPKISYGIFFFRDTSIIGFSFTMPPIIGKWASKKYGWDEGNAIKIAQMVCPLAVQFIATPLHLLGLDFYNNPLRTSTERLNFLKQESGKTIAVRMLRYLPAYSLGGVMNIVLREKFSAQFMD